MSGPKGQLTVTFWLVALNILPWPSQPCPPPSTGSCWARELTWVGEPRLLSSKNSSNVTISLLGEAERGRAPVWAGAAPLFWIFSWGTGPFRSGGYSWRLRIPRPGVPASRDSVVVSLLGIRSELPKLSHRPCRRSEEPVRATQGHTSVLAWSHSVPCSSPKTIPTQNTCPQALGTFAAQMDSFCSH